MADGAQHVRAQAPGTRTEMYHHVRWRIKTRSVSRDTFYTQTHFSGRAVAHKHLRGAKISSCDMKRTRGPLGTDQQLQRRLAADWAFWFAHRWLCLPSHSAFPGYVAVPICWVRVYTDFLNIRVKCRITVQRFSPLSLCVNPPRRQRSLFPTAAFSGHLDDDRRLKRSFLSRAELQTLLKGLWRTFFGLFTKCYANHIKKKNHSISFIPQKHKTLVMHLSGKVNIFRQTPADSVDNSDDCVRPGRFYTDRHQPSASAPVH